MHRTQLLALATGIVAHGGRARISHRARILQQIRKKALNKLTHGSNTNLPRPPLPPPIPLSAKVMVSRAGRDRQLQPLP